MRLEDAATWYQSVGTMPWGNFAASSAVKYHAWNVDAWDLLVRHEGTFLVSGFWVHDVFSRGPSLRACGANGG